MANATLPQMKFTDDEHDESTYRFLQMMADYADRHRTAAIDAWEQLARERPRTKVTDGFRQLAKLIDRLEQDAKSFRRIAETGEGLGGEIRRVH